MDTYKIIAFVVYCFFPSVAFSSVYNFTGAIYNSPGGLLGHVYQNSKPQLESGRIRTAPNFTFGTAAGKQVGFTASRLSTIATGRVGGALVNFARSTTPLGVGVTAAALLCTETQFCEDAGNWIFGEQFDLAESAPTSCSDISLGGSVRWVNGFDRTFEYTRQEHTNCGTPAPSGSGAIFQCPDSGSGCNFGETVYQKDLGVGNPNTPAHVPTDEDWDSIANDPALNNDSVVPDLLAGNQPVPVEAPDQMAPQNYITSSETTTLKDSQGNVTGSQVTERRVDITDVSDANNPNSFDITEKKTVTNYDINNNIVNSETTVINNEQPAQTEEEPITFDTVEPEVLLFKDIEIPFDVTPWGSGTCPGNLPIGTSFQAMEFNVQPICDFAVAMKPIILLIASVVGAMIMIGVARSP